MFHKVAKFYEKKKQFDLASDFLDKAEDCQNSLRRDWSVAVTKARVLLDIGQYSKSFKLAATVLQAESGPFHL